MYAAVCRHDTIDLVSKEVHLGYGAFNLNVIPVEEELDIFLVRSDRKSNFYLGL
jgi:hypothetical protein